MKGESTKLEWRTRYSSTDEPDEVGRWSRILYLVRPKGENVFGPPPLMLAWVSMIIHKDGRRMYSMRTFFPVAGTGDAGGFSTVRSSYEAVKEMAEELFEEFTAIIKKHE